MHTLIRGRKTSLIALGALLLASSLSLSANASTKATASKPSATATKRTSSSRNAVALTLDGPEVRSSSALVFDATSSTVLFSRNADEPLPIASITKLMTALVVLEAELPLDEKIQITKDDRDTEKNSYSRIAIGAKLTRDELLRLALMSSENRAAHALGRAYPGGLNKFVRRMNAKAQDLGMTRTKFVEPTGLSSRNVASPADLAKLVIAASEDPLIREYSTGQEYAVTIGRQVLTFRNTNTLVSNPTWNVQVQKTGFINEAGQCLVMKAVIDDREIVMVLLNSFGKYTRVADAKRIRNWMESKQLSAAATRSDDAG